MTAMWPSHVSWMPCNASPSNANLRDRRGLVHRGVQVALVRTTICEFGDGTVRLGVRIREAEGSGIGDDAEIEPARFFGCDIAREEQNQLIDQHRRRRRLRIDHRHINVDCPVRVMIEADDRALFRGVAGGDRSPRRADTIPARTRIEHHRNIRLGKRIVRAVYLRLRGAIHIAIACRDGADQARYAPGCRSAPARRRGRARSRGHPGPHRDAS